MAATQSLGMVRGVAARCTPATRGFLRVLVARRTLSVHAAASAGQAQLGQAQQQQQQRQPLPSWEVRMLYDGECPLCMKEVNFLKSRDAGKGRIDFVDIASADYDPAQNQGITFEQAMRKIHAILADGTIVTDVEVFRRLYEAVGLGWVYAATKNEAVLKLANAVYGVWAKYRMEVTGREGMEVILQRRRAADESKGSLCRDVDADGGGTACEIQPVAAAKATKQ